METESGCDIKTTDLPALSSSATVQESSWLLDLTSTFSVPLLLLGKTQRQDPSWRPRGGVMDPTVDSQGIIEYFPPGTPSCPLLDQRLICI